MGTLWTLGVLGYDPQICSRASHGGRWTKLLAWHPTCEMGIWHVWRSECPYQAAIKRSGTNVSYFIDVIGARNCSLVVDILEGFVPGYGVSRSCRSYLARARHYGARQLGGGKTIVLSTATGGMFGRAYLAVHKRQPFQDASSSPPVAWTTTPEVLVTVVALGAGLAMFFRACESCGD